MKTIYAIVPIKCEGCKKCYIDDPTDECNGWELDWDSEHVIAYGDKDSVDLYLKENSIPRNKVHVQEIPYVKEFK